MPPRTVYDPDAPLPRWHSRTVVGSVAEAVRVSVDLARDHEAERAAENVNEDNEPETTTQ